MFINHEYINEVLEKGKEANSSEILEILKKAEELKGLDHLEIAKLLNTEDKDIIQKMFDTAGRIKKDLRQESRTIRAPLHFKLLR